jgi:hypothetical protein
MPETNETNVNNADNVTYGKPKVGGSIFVAPVGTALPTDATTALDAAFKNAGYCSDDGLENEYKIDTDTVKAWGGNVVLNVDKGREDNFSFTMIESLRPDALKMVFGDDNVTGELASGIKLDVNASDLVPHSYVFELIAKGGILHRIVVPNATLSDLDKITYKDDDAVGFNVTLTASADKSGNTHYEYYSKGA